MQSGPWHSPEKHKLSLQPTSPVSGTKPLDAKRKGNAAASLKEGLRVEVEEASVVAGFERDHQLVI